MHLFVFSGREIQRKKIQRVCGAFLQAVDVRERERDEEKEERAAYEEEARE